MQQTGSQGRRLVLSVQTFKKCPFYAGLFCYGKIHPNQILNVKETDGQIPRTHGADASLAPTVFRSPLGPTFECYRICLRPQPREANLNNRVGEVVLPGRAYAWRAQELASEQRGSGSAARGGAYWSRIDQGTAAGVARNSGADESAGRWREHDHSQF